MPKFAYKATNKEGKPTFGVVDAESQALAVQDIRSLGLFPTNLREATRADEKKALKALVAGKTGWYEAEEVVNGKRTLRVATAVPVVFEKCVMCHDNYADIPKGQAMGALTYKITIE